MSLGFMGGAFRVTVQHPRDFSSKLKHFQRSMGRLAFNASILRASYSSLRFHACLDNHATFCIYYGIYDVEIEKHLHRYILLSISNLINIHGKASLEAV